MRWKEHPGMVMRKVCPAKQPGMIVVEEVDPATLRKGDLDLRAMRAWITHYGEFQYLITTDGEHPELGYTASATRLDNVHAVEYLATEVATFTKAEEACKVHYRRSRN